MEIVIKNDSNIKVMIYKDEVVVSSITSNGDKSSSVVQDVNCIRMGSHR